MCPGNPNSGKTALARDVRHDYATVGGLAGTTVAGDPRIVDVQIRIREAEELLGEIGGLLLERSCELACSPGKVQDFLNTTELLDCIEQRLPNEFRAFCLVAPTHKFMRIIGRFAVSQG